MKLLNKRSSEYMKPLHTCTGENAVCVTACILLLWAKAMESSASYLLGNEN